MCTYDNIWRFIHSYKHLLVNISILTYQTFDRTRTIATSPPLLVESESRVVKLYEDDEGFHGYEESHGHPFSTVETPTDEIKKKKKAKKHKKHKHRRSEKSATIQPVSPLFYYDSDH